jgi:hypothetical protein
MSSGPVFCLGWPTAVHTLSSLLAWAIVPHLVCVGCTVNRNYLVAFIGVNWFPDAKVMVINWMNEALRVSYFQLNWSFC